MADYPTLKNFTAPLPPRRPADLNYYGVLGEAQKMFPFINQYDPHIKVTPRQGAGYAETFGPNEEGAGDFRRPQEFPMKATGIEVYKPEQFAPADYAAEYLHVDPRAHETRAALQKTFTPRQIAIMQHEPDYTDSIKYGLTQERAMNNMTDGVMRGYVTQGVPNHQWPQEAIDDFGFNDQQRQMLDSLRNYMRGVPTPGGMK